MGKRLHKIRKGLIFKSEKWHGSIHFLFGILAYLIGYNLNPDYFNQQPIKLLLIAIFATFFPDIDHLLYIFGYGRKKNYAIECKKLFIKKNWRGLLDYIKTNHKNNTGIYSHNIATIILVVFLTFYYLNTKENLTMALFFLAWTFHYIYDVLEDLLFFKKLNKNWFLIFNKPKV